MNSIAILLKSSVTFTIVLHLLIPTICSSKDNVAEKITPEKALTIAEKHVREKNNSWGQIELHIEMEGLNNDGNWMVTVWRIPYAPGGHRYVEIDQKGNVVIYELGL